jgi:hypothetical protein
MFAEMLGELQHNRRSISENRSQTYNLYEVRVEFFMSFLRSGQACKQLQYHITYIVLHIRQRRDIAKKR